MWFVVLVGVSLFPIVMGSFPFSSTMASDQGTGQPLYQLRWTFDDVRKTITFNVVVRTTGWVGFGLSPNGGMVGSDVVIGWISNDGTTYFHDRYAFAMATPPIDPSQDWTLLSGSETNGYTNLTFTRKWVTCDSSRDRDIKAETVKVVFSWGTTDPQDASLAGQYHGANKGSKSLNLLGGLVNAPPTPSDAKNFSLTVTQVTIPTQSTTYWCAGFKLPAEIIAQKKYITRISPQISPGNEMYVHHMLIYQCISLNETTDVGQGYDCNRATNTIRNCRLGRPIMAAWAVGGDDFIYPEGIAFPIGGQADEQYVVVEMHYNNPSLASGVKDSSGFVLTYSGIPPTYEAGILTVGQAVSPLMIIPPRDPSYTVHGTCNSQCTTLGIPSTGINIFANFLHTHLVGRAVTLRQLRTNSSCGGIQELPPIDQNMHYDFDFQQTTILPSPVRVLPGDTLQVLCTYNTTGVNNVTVGGESTYDEMCLSFPVYYPRIELAACLSVINTASYNTFAQSNLAPSDYQALVALINSQSNYYNGIKSIFGTLAWTQQQQSDLQATEANANFYGSCFARNGSWLRIQSSAPVVKCPYTAPILCESAATGKAGMGTYAIGSVALIFTIIIHFLI